MASSIAATLDVAAALKAAEEDALSSKKREEQEALKTKTVAEDEATQTMEDQVVVTNKGEETVAAQPQSAPQKLQATVSEATAPQQRAESVLHDPAPEAVSTAPAPPEAAAVAAATQGQAAPAHAVHGEQAPVAVPEAPATPETPVAAKAHVDPTLITPNPVDHSLNTPNTPASNAPVPPAAAPAALQETPVFAEVPGDAPHAPDVAARVGGDVEVQRRDAATAPSIGGASMSESRRV